MITIVAMDPFEARVGLCATCQFRRDVVTPRSTFFLCERSFTDQRFAKYPPIPVIRCLGYLAKADSTPVVD